MKKIISVIISFIMAFTLMQTAVFAAAGESEKITIIDSGKSNRYMWTLTSDGTLTFSGEGTIGGSYGWGTDDKIWDPSYEAVTEAPWGKYKDIAKTLIIEEGITGVNRNAFHGMKFTGSLVLPETFYYIADSGAFWNCGIKDFYFKGNPLKEEHFDIQYTFNSDSTLYYPKGKDWSYRMNAEKTKWYGYYAVEWDPYGCLHDCTDWYSTIEPACTEKGEIRRDCKKCDHYEIREVETTGHIWEKHVTEPTCFEDGIEITKCKNCDHSIKRVLVSSGHVVVTLKETSPTCTEEGLTMGKYCMACDMVLEEQKKIPAYGHKEITDSAVAATCTKDGLTEGKHCSVCKTVLIKQETVKAKGHQYGEWYVIEEATDEKNGEERRECKNCEYFETRTLYNYIRGDINNDGKVNNKDVTRLFQYLSGMNVSVAEKALDVNGDGKVNNKDVTRLFQYLSGMDVKIY